MEVVVLNCCVTETKDTPCASKISTILEKSAKLRVKRSDIWNYNKPRVNDLHPTMKPVELVERAIKNSSKSRDIVLDLFGGSGTTLIASEKTGRQARLIELDPKFVDVIIKRWEDYTGQQAVREDDGLKFSEASEKALPDSAVQ